MVERRVSTGVLDNSGSWFNPLRWRHTWRDGASNHQPPDCLLNRLFRRRSKKTSKLRVTGLCAGNSPGPVNSPHKWPVTRKMFPFDDVIMPRGLLFISGWSWFSLTMGMLRVVFEIIVGAAQNLPLLRQYYRLKNGILVIHAVHRGTVVGVSEITKYILFWCRHRYLGVVILAKGLSLLSYHFHLRMPKAELFPPVRYFLRKSQELFRVSQKYPSLHVFCQISKWLL